MENFEFRISELGQKYGQQLSKQESKLKELEAKVQELNVARDALKADLKKAKDGAGGGGSGNDMFVRRVEWKIDDLKKKTEVTPKGESIWSSSFNAAGVAGMQLEFFPNGRESTSFAGFCSLFLWCPSGTKIRYQLWVGNHLRAPDEDDYDGRMGHGHSNFCMLSAESTSGDGDSVTVGVDILEVKSTGAPQEQDLKCIQSSFADVLSKEMAVIANKDITRVEWRITQFSKRLKSLPRGSSLYSPHISMGGIADVLLEFYPNGSQNTTKDGFCAFYIRGPQGTSVTVTLFVGNFKKGPITTTFDGATGKGLPDFCDVAKEVDNDKDCLVVGIDMRNNNADKPASVHVMET